MLSSSELGESAEDPVEQDGLPRLVLLDPDPGTAARTRVPEVEARRARVSRRCTHGGPSCCWGGGGCSCLARKRLIFV